MDSKGERISYDELRAMYPVEWVIISHPRPEPGRDGRFLGVVRWHGYSEMEANEKVPGLGPGVFTILDMGNPTRPDMLFAELYLAKEDQS